MKAKYLNKTEVTTMIKHKCDGKPHLIQVYALKSSESEKKSRISMKVSDGCHYIRAASIPVHDIKNFDIINIVAYRTTEIRGSIIMLIEKLERVYTNVEKLIGSPVEYNKENPNEHSINTEIPNTAKYILGGIEKVVSNKAAAKSESPLFVKTPVQIPAEMKGVKPIKALGLHSNDWTIKVRLIRKGEQKKFMREKTGESYLLPLEFIDNEGTQISATLFGSGVDKFQSMLKLKSCYLVSNGNVKFANKKYTSIKTDYSINLDVMSNIEEVADDPSIPREGYCFTPIAKIIGLPNSTMIDVIGIVHSTAEASMFPRRDGTQTTKRTIVLGDDSGHAIEVTLWGALAENEFKVDEIVAFKSVKVSNYNGKQLNTTGDTIIVKDPEDCRVKCLRRWRESTGINMDFITLTNKSTFNGYTAMLAEVIKTGETMDTDPKGMLCWISGNIITVQYEKGFHYMGCKKCKRKTVDIQCDRCKEDAIPYYMFNMKISDGTDSIWIHVFGEQGEMILGRPASELLALQEKDNSAFRQVFERPKGNVKLYITS